MKIGELAKSADCKVVTIRYYEKKGLMPRPGRTESNYRNYEEKDLERLIFIRHCRRHGINLDEIEKLLQLSAGGTVEHAEIHALIMTHIARIERQLAELAQLKSSLESMLNNCHGNGEACDILACLKQTGLCAYCGYKQHQEKM